MALEYDDDDISASDDEGVDAGFAGSEDEFGEDVDVGMLDDEAGGEGDDDEMDAEPRNEAARLRQAALRQQPAAPGPGSAAAANKERRLVADSTLLLGGGIDTSDAAILQLEADELLSETRAGLSKGSKVAGVVARLKEVLAAMPEHVVSMTIAKAFVEQLGQATEDSLTIKPPAAVAVIGSAAYGALARPDPTVDIAVELPTDFLAPKAHLNYRYHARRAAYLVAVAAYLRDASYSLYGEQRIECLHGDPARPALVIRPATAEGYSLRLLPAIAPDTFALPRLAPDRNGVRAHTKEAKGQLAAGGAATEEANSAGAGQQQQQLLPTPHYNAGIVEDMMFSIHAARLKAALSSAPQLTDGLHLLKVWARQHGLAPCSSSSSSSSIGTRASWGCGGCLDGAVLASLVALLAERNKMVGSMSALQVFRGALQLLADAAAWAKGLAMARAAPGELPGLPPQHTPPAMQVFKAAHAVVFVDCTGWLNLAAHMTRGSLAHAQLAARTTLQLLTHPADPDEAFASAFLTPASPSSAFDYHWAVAVAPPAALQQQLRQEAEGAGRKGKKGKGATSAVPEDAKDGGSGAAGSGASAFRICKDRVLWREQEDKVEQLLRQGLSDRAKVVRVLRRPLASTLKPEDLATVGLPPLACSPSTGGAPEGASSGAGALAAVPTVWAGAVVDPLLAQRLVDVGPAADDAAAAARFRRFWGERSELRRWQDGKITETAVWECPPHARHAIPDVIVSHVVARHLPPGSALHGCSTSLLDWALAGGRGAAPGSDLAAARAAEAAADKLGKQLRALDGLALKVVGVQPLSPTSRGTAPFPPQPHPLAGGAAAAGGGGGPGGGVVARCLDPLEVLVTLESSGRWPDDPSAFRKMKAALGVQLANSLAAAYGHSATASEDYVEVLLDGFAFRLMLYSGRDEAMLTKIASMAAPSGPGGAAAGVDAGAVGMGAAGTGTGTVGAGVLSPEESPLMLSWHHGLVSHVAGANCAYAPAARLAQRWLAAHLMSNHVAPAAAELLVAAAFGGAGGPATAPPGSRLSGFLRFLQLVARWPWRLKPLVVDPAAELKEADRRALRSRFDARRAAGAGAAAAGGGDTGPALYLCTPRDRESQHWTQRGPSAAALQRLSALAARSAALLELLLQPSNTAASSSSSSPSPPSRTPSGHPADLAHALLATPACDFDAFLLLRKEALPHADLALPPRPRPSTIPSATSSIPHALLVPPGQSVAELLAPGGQGQATPEGSAPLSGPDVLSDALEGPLEPPPKRARAFLRAFPDKVLAAKASGKLAGELLVGFDPVSKLLAELQSSYGSLAMFCSDSYGGRLVGVKWRPDVFLPQPLRLNTAHTALPCVLTRGEQQGAEGSKGQQQQLCVPNVFAVLAEMRDLGEGLVDDVVMPVWGGKARGG